MKKKLAYVLLVLSIAFLIAIPTVPALAQGATPVIPASDLTNVILFVVGVIVSTAFSYFPALKVWYGNQTNNGWIMLAVTAVVSAAYFGLSCSPLAATLNIQVSCTQLGVIAVFWGFVNCILGGQLTYLMTGSALVATVVPSKPVAPPLQAKPAG
jgi:archaellum biogenesis protein FlaJ (TadC family)